MSIRITLIGAGSTTFGQPVISRIIASKVITSEGLDVVLMDVKSEHLSTIKAYTEHQYADAGIRGKVTATTSLEEALSGADVVITAIEVERYYYWSQDFHIPRKHGFNQVYGENGEIGGIFHALRNIPPMIEIARTMERLCPTALLLNFTNPEHKLCEAINRLTSITSIGLCSGVFMGRSQIAAFLEMDENDLETEACGMNHFTWFTRVRDRRNGADLYEELRKRERAASPLYAWNEIGLGRILFRRYGLWPSPAANHYAEYLGWAKEFVAENVQYYFDPAEEDPWGAPPGPRTAGTRSGGPIPEFIYSIDRADTETLQRGRPKEKIHGEDEGVDVDSLGGDLAVSIIEGYRFGEEREVLAGNLPNRGAIANLPDDMVVELPFTAKRGAVERRTCGPLPEGIASVIRTHGTIHRLIVEAVEERSRDKLLHAILLDPVTDSYTRAVHLMNEMLDRQRELLPELH